ncbi:YgaP family membrane protein [Bradyrhizobium embrapense]
MTRNVGLIDQYARIVIGLALIAYTVKDGSLGAGWLIVGTFGFVLIATALLSYCPLYTLLGVNTRQKSSSV